MLTEKNIGPGGEPDAFQEETRGNPVHRDGANLCTGYAIAQPQKTKTVFFLKD